MISKIYISRNYWVAIALVIACFSCKKQEDDYLNVKAQNSDLTPKTFADFQALLDNDVVMNQNYPELGLASADNFYLLDAQYASLGVPDNTACIWATDIFEGQQCADWNYAFTTIEYANIVLEGIQSIPLNSSVQAEYNNLKGSALFYRAFANYNLAATFCKPYTKSSANTDPGLPLRLTSDPNAKVARATVQQTYDLIIGDLKSAVTLLPAKPSVLTRPAVTAAYALLAKVYLSMEDYENAFSYADSTLRIKSDLMDFNNSALVTASSYQPFPGNPADNPEIIFYATGIGHETIWTFASRASVDSLLFKSYDANDWRKTAFFYSNGDGTYSFQGTYDEYNFDNFSGIATNEIYLDRAECYARAGNVPAAMTDLNALLSKRFVSGSFNPLATTNADTALSLILQERRKELPFTANCRWEDLRRLNKDPRFAITLKRGLLGQIYILPPNDPKYVLPIPDNEIQLTGISQNPR